MNRTSSLRARPRALLAPFSAIAAALAVALAGSAAAGAPAALAAPAQDTVSGGTWARAKANAAVRNFADTAGAELVRLDAGHPLKVFGTSDGTPRFYEVEVGGGVPVWVFGELLQPTNIDGVLRVDAQGVNMRPMPETSARSMALRTKLSSGARLVLIERHDASKPLADDWVKVWSPDAARVWIEVSEVELVAAGDAGATSAVQTAWVEATRQAPTAREVERQKAKEKAAATGASERQPALAAVASVPPAAIELITEADEKFDAALARADTDSATWAEISGLYERTIALAPAGTATATRAAERQKSSEARRELAALRESMAAEDDRRKRELAEIMVERERSELGRTTHMGRYQGRGFLYSRVIGGERRWYIEWKGETVAEVRCSSERYDLTTFQGYELGLTATTISPPTSATALSEALPKVLDIMRIEVLSGGQRRR